MKKALTTLFLIALLSLISIIYYNIYFKEVSINTEDTIYHSDEKIVFKEYKVEPPIIKFSQSERSDGLKSALFKTCNQMSTKEKVIGGTDYENVRNIAVMVASPSKGSYNLGQVCDLYDYCKSKWSYVDDPITSFISSASNTVASNYTGDCDDFAILLSALVLAVGGETRTNFGYGADGGHAFTEVNLGTTNLINATNYLKYRYRNQIDSNFKINGRTDSGGSFWMNLDWFTDYPGGIYFPFENGFSYYPLQNFCEKF